MGGSTNIRNMYSASGVESFFAAHAISGAAMSRYSQKLGRRNDADVRTSHTLRRRAKSSCAVKRRQSGFAAQNITDAKVRTTTRALRLTSCKVG